MNQEDVPTAEVVVLRRVGQMEGRAVAEALGMGDYTGLRALVVGQIVSTGDEFASFEIIEIVPPDEPAYVSEDTIVEMA